MKTIRLKIVYEIKPEFIFSCKDCMRKLLEDRKFIIIEDSDEDDEVSYYDHTWTLEDGVVYYQILGYKDGKIVWESEKKKLTTIDKLYEKNKNVEDIEIILSSRLWF